MAFHVPEKYRDKENELNVFGMVGTGTNNGVFSLPYKNPPMTPLRVIASDGEGWEHVSVSMVDRIPIWNQMCHIKDIFWDPEDCVVQYHPPKSEYVNFHPYCLHLWRPTTGIQIPRPPKGMIG